MAYLKHKDGERSKKSKSTKKQETAPQVVAVNVDMPGVEAALEHLAGVASTYTKNALNGDNGSGLYSSPDSYPVKIALHEDSPAMYVCLELEGAAVNSIADSLKCIADALTGQARRDRSSNGNQKS